MRYLFEFAVLSAVALTGCGENLCTEYIGTTESYVKKYATECYPGVFYSRPDNAVIEQCNADAHALCTEEDRKYIESLSECLGKLPMCTSDSKDSFDQQVRQCTDALEGTRLSDDCRTAGQRVFLR